MKNIFVKASAALALLLAAAQAPAAVTNVLNNGSFETGLAGWTTATNLEAGAAGNCGYNSPAVAPGTETISSTAGFAATAGTRTALGFVQSTSGAANRFSCVLYQDVAIPAGATTATFSYDIGIKSAAGSNVDNAARVGVYSTATVPGLLTAPLVPGAYLMRTTWNDVALSSITLGASFDVSAFAGSTVRFAIINTAFRNGQEVIGIDNVQFLVTAPDAAITAAPVPTLNEWLCLVLAGMLVVLAGRTLPSRRRPD